MKQPSPHIDALIARYLAGEALPGEAMELDNWRAEADENEQYFTGMYTLYHGVDSALPTFDADSAWMVVHRNMEPQGPVEVRQASAKVISIKRTSTPWLRVAAGIALLAVLAVAAWLIAGTRSIDVQYVSASSITTDTVHTGSVITLNTNSSLAYKFDKSNNKEVMQLNGQAYFDLRAPASVATVVEAGELTIRDIGTAFHVSAYPESDTVQVWVDEGEVAMYTSSNPGISLRAGEGGIYVRSTGIIMAFSPALLPNWHVQAKEFHFNNATLWEVAEAFNKSFDLKLVVPNHLQFCRITVSFVDETPLAMASIIAETLGLTLEQTDGTLRFTGYGCPK